MKLHESTCEPVFLDPVYPHDYEILFLNDPVHTHTYCSLSFLALKFVIWLKRSNRKSTEVCLEFWNWMLNFEPTFSVAEHVFLTIDSIYI